MNTSISIDTDDKLGLEALEVVKQEARQCSQSFSNVVRNLLVAEAFPHLAGNKKKQIQKVNVQVKPKTVNKARD